jgi:hypothetical protein
LHVRTPSPKASQQTITAAAEMGLELKALEPRRSHDVGIFFVVSIIALLRAYSLKAILVIQPLSCRVGHANL